MAKFAGRLRTGCSIRFIVKRAAYGSPFLLPYRPDPIQRHLFNIARVQKLFRKPIVKSVTTTQLEKVELGGVKQWLLIRGDEQRPVLLVLHGGPGSADIATASRYQRDLEKHFLVVNWDQRGAGKSHGNELSVQQFVTDATELINLLLVRFGKQKLYLLGHSWGSALGLLIAHRFPELVYGYIGVGQLVDTAENERSSFDYVQKRARQTGNRLASQLRPPPNGDDVQSLLTQRTWLYVFRGFFYSRRNALHYALAFLSSKTYSLRDKLRYSQR